MEILETGRRIGGTEPSTLEGESLTSRVAPRQHVCEACKCCSCVRDCMKCRQNCEPREDSFIPVVACPDFEDIRSAPRIRYLYRSDYTCVYRLHLPNNR